MTYHPLSSDTGGTADDRVSEKNTIVKIIEEAGVFDAMTSKEQDFLADISDAQQVSPKQLFWLRDIKDKYL